MVVIFFNLGLVLAFILLVSIVFINASTKFVLAILRVNCDLPQARETLPKRDNTLYL